MSRRRAGGSSSRPLMIRIAGPGEQQRGDGPGQLAGGARRRPAAPAGARPSLAADPAQTAAGEGAQCPGQPAPAIPDGDELSALG